LKEGIFSAVEKLPNKKARICRLIFALALIRPFATQKLRNSSFQGGRDTFFVVATTQLFCLGGAQIDIPRVYLHDGDISQN